MANLPSPVITGQTITPDVFNRLLDAIRASRIIPGIGYRLDESTFGTRLAIDKQAASTDDAKGLQPSIFDIRLSDSQELEVYSPLFCYGIGQSCYCYLSEPSEDAEAPASAKDGWNKLPAGLTPSPGSSVNVYAVITAKQASRASTTSAPFEWGSAYAFLTDTLEGIADVSMDSEGHGVQHRAVLIGNITADDDGLITITQAWNGWIFVSFDVSEGSGGSLPLGLQIKGRIALESAGSGKTNIVQYLEKWDGEKFVEVPKDESNANYPSKIATFYQAKAVADTTFSWSQDGVLSYRKTNISTFLTLTAPSAESENAQVLLSTVPHDADATTPYSNS